MSDHDTAQATPNGSPTLIQVGNPKLRCGKFDWHGSFLQPSVLFADHSVMSGGEKLITDEIQGRSNCRAAAGMIANQTSGGSRFVNRSISSQRRRVIQAAKRVPSLRETRRAAGLLLEMRRL
jgi:hypothetical protein